MSKISITRALAELKTLDDRINRHISSSGYVGYSVGGKPQGTQSTQQEVENQIRANEQSFKDLVSRRNKIKCAIVVSNAVTKVKIGEEEMTVAEAIERKNSISYEQSLLSVYRQQLAHISASVEKVNLDAKQRLDKLLEVNYGKDKKPSEEDYEAIAKPFMLKNEAKMIDPLKLQNCIDSLQKKIDDFLMNVDFSLSEINAVTVIEV